MSRQVYSRKVTKGKFEVVTPGRIYHLKEIKAGDAESWISKINLTINEHCNDK